MDRLLFRRLNHYDFGDYDGILNFIASRDAHPQQQQQWVYPTHIATNQQRQRFIHQFENFYVGNGQLWFRDANPPAVPNFNLRVLRNGDDAGRHQVMTEIYQDASQGMGHGVVAFYKIVTNKYLNIFRKHVEAFLKAQIPYQLTRKPVKPRNKNKMFARENECWVLDLIDMQRHAGVNQNANYILSCMDVFTRKCYLRHINNKLAQTVTTAMATFMKANNHPHLVWTDDGHEFKQEFDVFLDTLGITHRRTQTYTPQVNIEQLNGQIRTMLAELGVRRRNFVWRDALPTIENNLNTYNALPVNRLKREARAERQEDPDDPLNVQLRNQRAKMAVGDVVRVAQQAFLTQIRKQNKTGHQKHVFVKYSVLVFIVTTVLPRVHLAGFFHYKLRYDNAHGGQPLVLAGGVDTFRESDLMLCAHREGQELTIQQSNRLNNIA